MTKEMPMMPRPKGQVQLDLATYEQYAQLRRLLNAACTGEDDQHVYFDPEKVTAALTACVQLTRPAKQAQLGLAPAKAQVQYLVVMTPAGGADLRLATEPKAPRVGTLTEAQLRHYQLTSGDVVTATLTEAGHGQALQKVGQVDWPNDLAELTHGQVEAGDGLGLPGHLVVSHNQTTTLTDPSGMPYPYVIPEPVVTQYQLQAGDFVDLRWYRDELMTMQVVWRYDGK